MKKRNMSLDQLKWLMKKALAENVQIYQEKIAIMEEQKREELEKSIQKKGDLKTPQMTPSTLKRSKSPVHMFPRRKKSRMHREKSKSIS